jgi:Family of unknown function (DUF6167)
VARTLWFAAGAGAGVYVMVRARRLAEAFTPDGLRDRASAAVLGLRALREEVAQGQAEKETELRQRLHLVPHEGLDPARPPGELEGPVVETVAARPPAQPPQPAGDTDGKHKREGTA